MSRRSRPALPATMRAVSYERTGPAADVLVLREVETPRPGPGEVLVEIAASGVNPHDTKTRSGWTGRPMPHARVIPHSDGAGVIVATGDGVEKERSGERVWIYRADHRPGMGAAAGYVVVPTACAVPLPNDLSFAIGAGLGVPALTAYAAVFAGGPVAGLDILIQAAPARFRLMQSSSRARTEPASLRQSVQPRKPRTRGAMAPTSLSTTVGKTSRPACWH